MNLLSIIFFVYLYNLHFSDLYSHLISVIYPTQNTVNIFFAAQNQLAQNQQTLYPQNQYQQTKYQLAQNQKSNNQKSSNQKTQNTSNNFGGRKKQKKISIPNGDVPKNFKVVLVWKKRLKLLPVSAYRRLSSSAKHKYIKNVKKIFLKFELAVKDTASVQSDTALLLLIKRANFLFISRANAAQGDPCIVGGVLRTRNAEDKCPMDDRICELGPGSFRCGDVYGNHCIMNNSWALRQTVSDRCHDESTALRVSALNYPEYKARVEATAQEYCNSLEDSDADDGCRNLLMRLKALENKTQERSPASALEKETEAGTLCMDDACRSTQEGSTTNELTEIQQTIDTATGADQDEKFSELMEYFTDNISEISQCNCERKNSACSGGCAPKAEIEELGYGSPNPFEVCTRPREKTNDLCMRYVRNSIMNTSRKFLKKFCKEHMNITPPVNLQDEWKCEREYAALETAVRDEGNSDRAEDFNICAHGFSFSDAFCAINLDGQGADHYMNDTDSDLISEPSVKERCNIYGGVSNTNVAYIPIKNDKGEIVEKIPLFKRVENTNNRYADFTNDPSTIPEGAIVLSDTGSDEGHIEIKTGGDQFCSDFCSNKSGTYGSPIKAVFEWNPRLAEFL